MHDENQPERPVIGIAANDNGSAETRVQSAVLTLARLLGRQIAREQFAELHAANDNRPTEETREPQTRQMGWMPPRDEASCVPAGS